MAHEFSVFAAEVSVRWRFCSSFRLCGSVASVSCLSVCLSSVTYVLWHSTNRASYRKIVCRSK